MSTIALVLAGGDRPPPHLTTILPPAAFTIAADSGVDHARSLRLHVDAVVGDLDSADPEAVTWARQRGAVVERHRPDKDQTDLELALATAVAWINDRSRRPGPAPGGDAAPTERANTIDELVVIGLSGGRFDHLLANVLTVAGPLTAATATTAYIDRCRVTVVRSHRTLTGRSGDIVTLLAVGGRAEGVTTTGLAYPLDDDVLEAGSSRGVSNVLTGVGRATVSVGSGTVVALQPDALPAADGTAPAQTPMLPPPPSPTSDVAHG